MHLTNRDIFADHLGNARVEFVAHGGAQPEVVQTSSYYPFGMTLRRNDYGSHNVNKYLYGSKELQDQTLAGIALNWYDFEARMYDPTIGRFLQTDPKAEKCFDVSPYTYCLNNPLRYTDPMNTSNGNITVNIENIYTDYFAPTSIE